MKITKKQPLRPRGRSEEKRQSTKNAIRDAYINGPQKEVQIIPAKRDMEAETEKKKLRVCAYCRVSTDEDTQASSYELQVQNYTRMIQENPEWEFAGIFADEGISGTSVLHREHFLEMIEKCKAGEIDLIITKQVSRFARNVLDSLNYIFMLRKLDPPVGVYFETEKLNTLDKSSDMVITVLSLVAQSESEQKSNSLKWSFKRRRAQGLGIYPSWALLGYRLDDEKSWEIVEDHRLLPPLYKPSSDVVSCKVCAALEKQIALVTADPYRIAVALASGFQRRSLTDIGHTVYLIFLAVLPSDDPGEHRAVSSKICFDGYIYFQRLIHRSSLHRPAPPYWQGNYSAPRSAALSAYSPSTSAHGI